MKVNFFTNIPTPYRTDFYNELSEYMEVEVCYEASDTTSTKFSFSNEKNKFSEFYASSKAINTKKINLNFLKKVYKERKSILILANYNNFSVIAAMILLKSMGKPFILNIDGGLIKKNEPFLQKKIKSFLLNIPSFYLSPSDSSDDYLAYYGANRDDIYRYKFSSVRKSQIFSSTTEEKKILKQDLGLNDAKNYISVGQFIERKGHDILVKSWPRNQEYHLTIIGDGSEYTNIQNYIKHENITNISLLSFMNSSELEKYYMAADGFILLTREDIWGLVINEAMAKGLPIITTTKCVAGIELVDNNIGSLVDLDSSFNLEDILKKIELCGGDYSLNKISQYTIESMANSVFNILLSLYKQ